MKKKIYYWGPFIDRVATVKAILNSVKSINKYSSNLEGTIIDATGEWHDVKLSNSNLNFVKLNQNFYKSLPKFSFIKSRLSYLIIFIRCFFPLKKLLIKDRPNFLIIHLIVTLPLILFLLFKFQTKLCLRISGKPKLNFFRRTLWKISSKKIDKIFCPTKETRDYLVEQNIFDKNVFVLEDPVLEVREISFYKKNELVSNFSKNQIILVGRLTRQKNFEIFIKAFSLIEKEYPDLKANIMGYGELKDDLTKLIIKKKLQKKIFLIGFKTNIYDYLKVSKFFILSSLWEDPGFVIVEAAACNTTIISSDCPSGPKEFLKNGKGGFLFKNNSVIDLSNKIKEAIESDPKEIFLKKKNAKLQSRKYSIFNHAKKLEYLLFN